MSRKIKIRAKLRDGLTVVKALMVHPMNTGLRKDPKTNQLIPAHFIEQVTAEYNNEIVFKCYIGAGLSKNPYLSFRLKNGKAGEIIKLRWIDNHGSEGFGEATIKV